MKTSQLLIALAVLAALLLSGCGAKETAPLTVPEGAQAGELIDLKDCEYPPPGSKAKSAAECGTLVVPENWDKADSRLIALPVVRFPASGANPAEPIFWLGGGPGESNLFGGTPPDWILKNHDLVSVGFRGVEGTVTLDCPEVNRLINAHQGKDL
ncbi:MAG TPA: hypothetical protein VFI11_06165, partial [Anaerolineales bacterium]|nr:hypothetical protein [Anaerolineales bacterium]